MIKIANVLMAAALVASGAEDGAGPDVRRFVYSDFMNRKLVYVDESNPASYREAFLPDICFDITCAGSNRLYAAQAHGWRVYALDRMRLVRDVSDAARITNATSVAEGPNGNVYVFEQRGVVHEYTREGRWLFTYAFPAVVRHGRALRFTPVDTALLGIDDGVAEVRFDRTAAPADRLVRTFSIPGARSAYQGEWLADGSMLVSGGYLPELVRFSPEGRILSRVRAQQPAGLNNFFYGGFTRRAGRTLVANWTGHSGRDFIPGWKLIELDDAGRVTWKWNAPWAGTPCAVLTLPAVPERWAYRADAPSPERLVWTRWWAKAGFWQRRIADAKGDVARGSKEYDIVFCGDSNTQNWEGWRAADDVANLRHWIAEGRITEDRAFIGPRQAWLDLRKKYRVLNLGISGDCTQHVLWRLTREGQLDGYRARYFCLLIGANNCSSTDGTNDPDAIVAGIRAIIAAIRAKHPESTILLHKCTPTSRAADNPAEIRHERVNGLIPALADGRHVILCDFTSQLKEKDGSQAKRFFADGLHLNEDGFRIWSSAVRAVVDADRSRSCK